MHAMHTKLLGRLGKWPEGCVPDVVSSKAKRDEEVGEDDDQSKIEEFEESVGMMKSQSDRGFS